jgi:preprotein translocase subunit YajC
MSTFETALLAAAAESSGGGLLVTIVNLAPLILIFGVMYLLLIRPQRRRQRETVALQSALQEGDEVELNSGILGFISSIEDDYLWLDIAEKVEVRVRRGAVARRLNPAPDKSA